MWRVEYEEVRRNAHNETKNKSSKMIYIYGKFTEKEAKARAYFQLPNNCNIIKMTKEE